MSTPQPLPVQAVLPASTGKVTAIPQSDSLGADSKELFGSVLGNELGAALVTESQAAVFEQNANFSINLPLDGKSLPPGINGQLQADIAALESENILTTELQTEPLETLALPFPTSFQLSAPSATKIDQAFAVNIPGTTVLTESPKTVGAIRFVNPAGTLPVRPEQVNQSAHLPFNSEQGLDAETLTVTQFKQTQQLQNLFSPLTRHAGSGIETGQISRVLEQFSEFTQRPAATPSISTPVSLTPLSESGLSSSSSGLTQLSVDVPVQDERWQKAFSQRVVWSVGNNQSAQLRIHPAELGRIDIQVNVDNDKASVVFNTQHGVVKEAIELALPRLREMLSEQGVELENVDVSQDDINQQQAGTDNDSNDESALEAGAQQTTKGEEAEHNDELIISDVSFNEDVVDYYV